MPHRSATAFKNAKSGATPRKVYDALGLFLYITPAGAKTWRMRYRFDGKDSQIVLGTYPEMSLADAREKRDEARKLIRTGTNPSAARKAAKTEREEARTNTFGGAAKDWLEHCDGKWKEQTVKRIKLYLDHASSLNARPVSAIMPVDVLHVVTRIAGGSDGRIETAKKTLRTIGAVMRHAVIKGRASADPTASIRSREIFRHRDVKKRPAMEKASDVAELMRKIHGYPYPVTRAALLILAHTLVRSNELRGARWEEIDFDAAEWKIPASRMKGRKDHDRAHTVPLSTQVVALLRELQAISGKREYLFPNVRDPTAYMSENTLSYALRALKVPSDQMSAHGFRSTGSALLNERAWRPDVIEAALAHTIGGVRGIYARTTFLPERREMMQYWSDLLESLRTSNDGKVVPIARGKVA